jgi:hypothetical protein
MNNNQHIQAIPSTVLAAAQTKIDEVLASLGPYLLAITPAERRELPKMGEKTIGFVEKAFDFTRQNPQLLPAYFSADEFGIDFGVAHGLWTLLNTIQQLEQGVDDTEMLAGSEAYQAALVFYKAVKMAAASPTKLARTSPVRKRSTKSSKRASPAASAAPARRKRRPSPKSSRNRSQFHNPQSDLFSPNSEHISRTSEFRAPNSEKITRTSELFARNFELRAPMIGENNSEFGANYSEFRANNSDIGENSSEIGENKSDSDFLRFQSIV